MHHMQKKYRSPQGFTLVELVIIVAIISILSTFAYTSYQTSIRKSKVAAVVQALNALVGDIEVLRLKGTRYNDTDASGTAVSGTPIAAHVLANKEVKYSKNTIYEIAFDGDRKITGYTLKATVKANAGLPDTCKNITINNLGVVNGNGCPYVK